MGRRGSVWVALAAAAILSGCEAEPDAVRPGTQPLARLDTPEARQRIEETEGALPKMASQQAAGVCAEILRISAQGRLLLDRSDPGRLVVNAELWERVPGEAQRAIVECVRNARSEGAGGPLAVVEADPAMFEP